LNYEKDLRELNKIRNLLDKKIELLEKKINKESEFEIGISWQPDDGFLLIDIENHATSTFDCLIAISENNKLDKSTFDMYGL